MERRSAPPIAPPAIRICQPQLERAGIELPQVFISYARPDKKRVAKLVTALRRAGFDTWWDDDIPAGAGWEETIEKALDEAEAVIVGWSPTSVASENVRSEARVARARGRLVQLFLEQCEPPLFFGERQGIDLSKWRGSDRDPAFLRVQDALQAAMSSDPVVRHPPVGKSQRFAMLAAVAALVAIVAIAGWWWTQPTAEPTVALASAPPAATTQTGTAVPTNEAAPSGQKPKTQLVRRQVSKPSVTKSRPQADRSQPREDELITPPLPPAPPPKTPNE